MMIVCPKCGRKSSEVKFIEAFCIDCYPYSVRLPECIELAVCARCGRMRLKGEWMPYNRKKIEEFAVSKIRGDFTSARYEVEHQTVVFRIKKDGAEIEISKPLTLKKIKSVCPECSKKAGGYYEAIIQLRGKESMVTRYERILTTMLKKSTFISKTEEKKEGVDLYVGSSKAVMEVLTELGLRTKMTRKLVGMKEGKRLHRTTFLLRFE
ncbi:MAG: NMD3-related protein [Candidatus Bilamarchaeaceae archaeon]